MGRGLPLYFQTLMAEVLYTSIEGLGTNPQPGEAQEERFKDSISDCQKQ
jgi:hypothetical protein